MYFLRNMNYKETFDFIKLSVFVFCANCIINTMKSVDGWDIPDRMLGHSGDFSLRVYRLYVRRHSCCLTIESKRFRHTGNIVRSYENEMEINISRSV